MNHMSNVKSAYNHTSEPISISSLSQRLSSTMLKNVVTLVTGGASGLGKATAERFASKGAHVVLCDLSTSKGAEVAAVIGHNSLFVPADVSLENDVKSLMAKTKEKFGRLDVIVNCAGISFSYEMHNFNTNKSHKMEDFRRILMVNVAGTFNVARLGVELIAVNEPDAHGVRGVIINTSASSGFELCQGQVANLASSGGINALTKSLAAEFRPHGIRVVAIGPGIFQTPLTDFIPEDVTECIREECILQPKRLGSPAEFALLAHRILQNSQLNGTTINFDAGLNMTL